MVLHEAGLEEGTELFAEVLDGEVNLVIASPLSEAISNRHICAEHGQPFEQSIFLMVRQVECHKFRDGLVFRHEGGYSIAGVIAALAHRYREFTENIPELHEGSGTEKRRFVGRTHKRKAHFFIFAASACGKVLEVVNFLATGKLKARKTHTTVCVQIVSDKGLQNPRLERRFEAVGIETARLKHVQAVNNECGGRIGHFG